MHILCKLILLYNKMSNYTQKDFLNANTYAQMRLLYEKTESAIKSGKNLKWQLIYEDGIIPYYCPNELTCYYGYPVITDKNECTNNSKYDTDLNFNTNAPGFKNGWYLKWDEDQKNCYKSNHIFTYECNHNFENPIKKPNLLQYDNETQRCNITANYCDAYGYLDYNDGTPPNYDDRSCKMSTGQTVVDAIFGDTIAKGVIGGGCF